MAVRPFLSSAQNACVKLRACVVTFLVQHGFGAGERVCAAGLTRSAVVVKTRAPVGRRPRFGFAGLLHRWLSCTNALLWSPMPPFNRQHRLRKLHLVAPGWLALASAAAYNRSINPDAQVRPCAARTRLVCAGYLQRYVALASHA
jgi:hypothetical protein